MVIEIAMNDEYLPKAEISDVVVEHPQSRIFKQMSNGVFTRMAILEWASKGIVL